MEKHWFCHVGIERCFLGLGQLAAIQLAAARMLSFSMALWPVRLWPVVPFPCALHAPNSNVQSCVLDSLQFLDVSV